MFAPSVDSRIDWFRILVQLKAEGYSLYSIENFTEISRLKLIGYKQGSEPKYHDGIRLLTFWSQAMGKPIAWAPTINPFSYRA